MNKLETLEKRWKELLAMAGTRTFTKEELEAYNNELDTLADMIEKESAKEYKGFIKELGQAGIRIDSIWDLVNTNERYPEAIEPLLKYLPLVKDSRTKEGFIRALAVKEAKGRSIPLLLKEFERASKQKLDLRWVIGNAINAGFTKEHVESLYPIVLDEENRWARDGFIRAISKVRTEETRSVLMQVIDAPDESTRKEVLRALKKFKT